MPDRSRNPYSAEWVRRAVAGEVTGRDASAVQALVQGISPEAGAGINSRIAESMNAWLEVDQSGDSDRPDFWSDWKRLYAAELRGGT